MRLSDEELGRELYAMRPLPAPAFTGTLERKITEGFPRERRLSVPMRPPRRLLAPAAAAVTLVVVAGVAITESDFGGPSGQPTPTPVETEKGASAQAQSGRAAGGAAPTAEGLRQNFDLAGGQASRALSAPAERVPARPPGAFAPGQANRVVESNAQLTLATDSDKVANVADSVGRVTHQYGGIVMSSNVTHGDTAEATFQLAIPSQHLQAALGDLSDLAHVQSASEGSIDITAPVSHARSNLAEAEARLASLRAQLAHANAIGDFTTADELIRKIREASYQADQARAQLRQLERRARYATVTVSVVSDGSAGGAWTLGDAFHDAGDVLRYAAGVAVVSAAVLLPVALLAGLVGLFWRAWVRRSREAALDQAGA